MSDGLENRGVGRPIRGFEARSELPTASDAADYRHWFLSLLEEAIARARRSREFAGVLRIHLGHFSSPNGAASYAPLEELVEEFGKRIEAVAQNTDTFAFLGGRDFAILRPAVATPGELTTLARELLGTLSKTLILRGVEARPHPNVGIALLTEEQSSESLFNAAEAALRHSRETAPHGFRYSLPPFDPILRAELNLHVDLHQGLARKEFFLEFQPQFDLRDGRILCIESFLRWRHPIRGILRPHLFLDAAEDSSMLADLSLWSLAEAARRCKSWCRGAYPDVPVSVNVSALQLLDPHLLDRMERVLRHSGLPARLMELELRETGKLEPSADHRDLFKRLRRTGLRLAIDNFGAGYNSLEHLANQPVHKLKISASLVSRVADSWRSKAVVEAIAMVGHRLRLTVVATGVEQEDQAKALASLGCDAAQGYFFRNPTTAQSSGEPPRTSSWPVLA